jgi:hypothetical protein
MAQPAARDEVQLERVVELDTALRLAEARLAGGWRLVAEPATAPQSPPLPLPNLGYASNNLELKRGTPAVYSHR